MKRTILVLTSFAVLMVFAAFAPPAQARHSMKHMQIKACADKNEGDPCSFNRKGEDVNGTCSKTQHTTKLMCMASNTGTSESSSPAMASPSNGSEGGETSGATGSSSGTTSGGAMAPSGGNAGGSMGSPTGTSGGNAGGTAPSGR